MLGEVNSEALELCSSMVSEPDMQNEMNCSEGNNNNLMNDNEMMEGIVREELLLLSPHSSNNDTKRARGKNKSNNAKSSQRMKSLILNLISTNSELSDVYEVVSGAQSVKLRMRNGSYGFRYHPSTIESLYKYHKHCNDGIPLSTDAMTFLIAKLLQDISMEDISNDIWMIISNPFINSVGWDYDMISALISKIAQRTYYGPVSGLSKSMMEAFYIWELNDPKLLDDHELSQIITLDQLKRRSAHEMLLEMTSACNNPNGEFDISNINQNPSTLSISQNPSTLNINSNPSTLKNSTSSQKSLNLESNKKSNNLSSSIKSNAKISSFFSVFKKHSVLDNVTSEYFQPFFTKPNMLVSPYNLFSSLGNLDYSFESWNNFLMNRHIIPNSLRKVRGKCLGFDSRPILLVIKLLQFYDNYRPPYFGTWKCPYKRIFPRNPLRQLEELDYNYDSDDDWCEDAEISDAESIIASEEDDDENCDGSSLECSDNLDHDDFDNETNWLVPDGYISDDEGVIDHERSIEPEHGDKKRSNFNQEIPVGAPKSKRKYTEKQPIIIGPLLESFNPTDPSPSSDWPLNFIHIKFHWFPGFAPQLDPFDGPLNLKNSNEDDEARLESLNSSKVRINFEDSMLPDLALLLDETTLPIVKLYEIFSQKHGRVSRRIFDIKLNQIAYKTKLDGKTMRWSIRPEYKHVLPSSPSNQTDETGRVEIQ